MRLVEYSNEYEWWQWIYGWIEEEQYRNEEDLNELKVGKAIAEWCWMMYRWIAREVKCWQDKKSFAFGTYQSFANGYGSHRVLMGQQF